MRRIFGAIVISTAMLAATSAFPENVVWEQNAELARMWDVSRAEAAKPGDLLDRVFGQIEFRFIESDLTGTGSSYGQGLDSDPGYDQGAWAGNFRGGRVHEPAGR